MPPDASPRRSARRRVPSKKYSVDAFAGLDILESSDEEAERKRAVGQGGGDSSNASVDEFEASATDEDTDEREEEAEGRGSEGTDGSSIKSPDEASGGEDGIGNGYLDPDVDTTLPPIRPNKVAPVSLKRKVESSTTTRLRGLVGKPTKSSVHNRLLHYYGETGFDAIAGSCQHFLSSVIPLIARILRASITFPLGFEDGLKSAVSVSPRKFFDEIPFSLQNVAEGIQPTVSKSKSEYLPKRADELPVWFRKHNNSDKHSFKFGLSLALTKAFPPGDETEESDVPDKFKSKGWVLNVGGHVLSMSWAITKSYTDQILAIAIDQRPSQLGERTSPFEPFACHKASIQLWKFPSGTKEDHENPWTVEPKLAQVICNDWGTCRRLKWCPATLQDDPPNKDGVRFRRGLLAAIFSDGFVRVLNVRLSRNDSDIDYQLYKQAFLEARPPRSVCTCVDWHGSTNLIAGCADGCVAIWNILPESRGAYLEDSGEKPILYHAASDTFILDVASAAPTFPSCVAITSASGYQTLIDLRDPWTQNVRSQRSRIYASCIRFSPHMQVFFSTDEQGNIVMRPLRRFFNAIKILPSDLSSPDGAIISASPVHSSILIGTPAGHVECTNPVRKMASNDGGIRSQKWFKHEWSGASSGNREHDDLESDGPADAGTRELLDQSQGTVAMADSYGPQKLEFTKRVASDEDRAIVHYPEEQRVSTVEWNPNLSCGTWAAAGMGSGLVRVEDLGL